MEEMRSQKEMVVRPRDWQPQGVAATLWLEGPAEVLAGPVGQGCWEDSGITPALELHSGI